jgi:hypothetical protein
MQCRHRRASAGATTGADCITLPGAAAPGHQRTSSASLIARRLLPDFAKAADVSGVTRAAPCMSPWITRRPGVPMRRSSGSQSGACSCHSTAILAGADDMRHTIRAQQSAELAREVKEG